MSPRLRISATPLNGRWSLTSATRRDKAVWPPPADTLLSAMVAASAESFGDPRPATLYWLEAQGNPAIEVADLKPPRAEGIAYYSPVADRTPWEKGARQARWHNSVYHPTAVTWSWPIDTLEHVEALQAIAREITYIGSSRGPVLATVTVSTAPLPPDALVPVTAGTEGAARTTLRLRGIYPGRLDELEAAFQARRRPTPTETVGYIPAAAVVPARSPWGRMIPLRRAVGHRLHIAYGVAIAEAVRLAITHHPGLFSSVAWGDHRPGAGRG